MPDPKNFGVAGVFSTDDPASDARNAAAERDVGWPEEDGQPYECPDCGFEDCACPEED